MNLALRPYRHTDANVITTWLKSEYLMRQWCADRYERYPVTPEDMNSYHQQYFDGHNSVALTMVDNEDIVGYISIRTPADDSSEQRLGFVIIDDSRRGKGFGKAIVSMAVDYAFSKLGAIKVSLGVFETIRQLSGAMNRLDFIVLSSKRRSVMIVLARRGIVLRWNFVKNH